MKRPAALALFALLLVATFLSVTPRSGGAGAPTPGATVGMRATTFDLPTPEGGSVVLDELRGTPVLLNFWASWCEACRREMPELARLHQQYGSALTIVGVNDDEPALRVMLFAQQAGYNWTFALDAGGRVMQAYGVHYLPTSFFLDRNGVIRRVYTGPMTLGQMQAFTREASA